MPRRDPSVFERTAAGYGAVRPSYPDALFDFVVERTGLLADTATVLELGCGPGFVTKGFAERGFRVHAVDAARAMLEVARERVGATERVTFEQAVFEDWDGPAQPVDCVTAGMAWHWLDPDVRDAKIGPWLRPGRLVGAALQLAGVAVGRPDRTSTRGTFPDTAPPRGTRSRTASHRARPTSSGTASSSSST